MTVAEGLEREHAALQAAALTYLAEQPRPKTVAWKQLVALLPNHPHKG